MSQASYQLAHETVHLLAPVCGNANNLEEGVATYFAAYYIKKLKEPHWHPGYGPDNEKYHEVLKMVKPVLKKFKYCIKGLRRQQPSFSKMTRKQVSSIFSNNVDFLLKTFERALDFLTLRKFPTLCFDDALHQKCRTNLPIY